AAVPLAALAFETGGGQVGNYLTRHALPLLDKAVARAPDDVPALEARGFALFAQGRLDEALQALEAALAKAPEREQALTWAAEVAAAQDRLDLAEKYGRRLTEAYPQFPGHHERLALIQLRRQAWPEALAAAQTAVRLDPFRPEARALLIMASLETGNRARAQAEFDVLGVIDPGYQQKLRPQFAERLQRTK
ncbi:MAG TPA: tetratricopeptide repeat protein, partial [Gemmataceae bacterium]|nr:tetratricopeptide repeat protein [Gemmataceae bacterium]